MMLGHKVPAQEAMQMGMIYKYFEDDVFEASVNSICSELADLPPIALANTKRALQSSYHNSLHNQLIEEDELQQQAAASKDYQERVHAFVRK
jgi:2-(1,2-epoxy-1,2-dihydrophenyl)acetyl-CoA isomerase